MNAERYARVRELFLAVEDLSAEDQRGYLASQCGDDQELVKEVLSLLDEHDASSAQLEGESAKPPGFPPSQSATSSDTKTGDAPNDGSSPSEASDAGLASNQTAPFMPGVQHVSVGDSPRASSLSGSKRRSTDASAGGDRKSRPSKSAGGNRAAQVTQHGSQRTHASPRYRDESPSPRKPPSTGVWQSKAKRHRRFNSGWLFLAAILPTALIGWWTYDSVNRRLRASVASELNGAADLLQNHVRQFLNDRARMAELWSRSPELSKSIVALAAFGADNPSPERLRIAEEAIAIRDQMIKLSGRADIKYVVWDRAGRIIASWLEDGADVGQSVAPEGAANLARAMRGETVLFGPEILRRDVEGFEPETDFPVMAEIMPIRGDDGRVAATLLIRGFDMFTEFNAIFQTVSESGGLDVYAVNSNGFMVSDSPAALNAVGGDASRVACRLKVSDPGEDPADATVRSSDRRTQPLTYSVAGASTGVSGERMENYRNYVGSEVIGAWRWIDDWDLGIVVERSADSAFGTAKTVRTGFIVLAMILTLTALLAASQIAKRTAIAQAAVHPLSRYDLIEELGSGGMGVVYRAKHGQLGRNTALKVLRSDRDNLEERLRFDREARLAASLSNPHTVTIYDYGRGDEGEAYCVMEFLRGITLYDVVARSGFQAIGRVLFVLRQICDSLGEAHKLGLVHRDVKPQNVMLSLDASVGDWAVVFDFGLAKPLRPDADSYQTAETIWAGTPMYMAPERYREPNKIDPRSDIYSVGCIAYFLLSGRPPFIECDPESLFALVLTEQPISIGVHRDEEIPPEISQLVKKCMAKSVDERFSTVDELAVELDRLIAKHSWTVDQARSWWKIHGEELR